MAVRWQFFRAFYGEKKKNSTYITRRNEKSKKIAEEVKGLELTVAHRGHRFHKEKTLQIKKNSLQT